MEGGDPERDDLSARVALLRHPWASRVMESRTEPTPTVLAYMDSMIGMFRTGGFSMDLTHHAVHAMGSRLMGFLRQELFNDSADTDPAGRGGDVGTDGRRLPLDLRAVPPPTTSQSVVGPGCDDQFEFEFALDLMLDGLERAKAASGG